MRWLKVAGGINFGLAVLHIAIVFAGAPAYRYFGAGEKMATMAERGSIEPLLLTFVIALVFIVFGLYAFSGEGLIRRLPLLKIVLAVVAGIFTLRGLGFFVETTGIVMGYAVPIRHAIFSLASLLTGICFIAGIRQTGLFKKTETQ